MPNNGGAGDKRIVHLTCPTSMAKDKQDPKLLDKLRKCSGKFLIFCNMLYHNLIRSVGNANFWTKIHPYFRAEQKKLARSTDPFLGFLEDHLFNIKDLIIDPKVHSKQIEPTQSCYAMVSTMLKDKFFFWCAKNLLQRPPWSNATWQSAFRVLNIQQKRIRVSFPNPNPNGKPPNLQDAMVFWGIAPAAAEYHLKGKIIFNLIREIRELDWNCPSCGAPCILKAVVKEGNNKGRYFTMCSVLSEAKRSKYPIDNEEEHVQFTWLDTLDPTDVQPKDDPVT